VSQRRKDFVRVCVCACVLFKNSFSCVDSQALNDGVCVCEREGKRRSKRTRESGHV